jgi:hypothetical protein
LIRTYLLIIFTLCAALTASAAELQQLAGATLVPSGANDGDSFMIYHHGKKQIIRLYYVDCPETRASTKADLERVRAQTRYCRTAQQRPDLCAQRNRRPLPPLHNHRKVHNIGRYIEDQKRGIPRPPKSPPIHPLSA